MIVPKPQVDEMRRQVLAEHGARGSVVDELLEINRCRIEPPDPGRMPAFPIADEAHLEAWRGYAAAARSIGVWESLRQRFVQLRFPIREGISQEDGYRQATRRGVLPAEVEASPGLQPRRAESIALELHATIAGTVPVVTVANREDFVALVQAFTARNEPRPVPPSMGACLVSGLNNWDRVTTYRERWESVDERHRAPGAWGEEFKRLAARKELYQDRFVILSHGPYSNVSVGEAGASEDGWLEQSLSIRREHECTHYFTLRLFGRLQHNVLEELVADFVGLLRTFGSFDRTLALRFLGLERRDELRPDGRLHNYRGDPAMSDAAFAVVQSLAREAVNSLGRLAAAGSDWRDSPEVLARAVWFLSTLTLEELAAMEELHEGAV